MPILIPVYATHLLRPEEAIIRDATWRFYKNLSKDALFQTISRFPGKREEISKTILEYFPQMRDH
ncbi:MAG: hypothetical protein R6V12_10145 [Candidatus Hydrogenedentota bacterium]